MTYLSENDFKTEKLIQKWISHTRKHIKSGIT